MLTAIRQWVIKTMIKDNTGVVQTLPKRDLIELNTQITAQRLMQNGVDPEALTNVNQVENAINAIDNRPRVQEGIKSTDSAKIMDLEGKEIPKGSKIMGGKQAETEAEIAARMSKENKEAAESLRQKMKKEKARTKRISGNLRADNMNRYEIGKPKLDEDEYNYYREILDDEENFVVKGDETFEQLEAMVKEAEDEVAYMKRLYDKGALDPPEDMAQGGRAGFKGGLSKAFSEFLKKFKVKQSGDDVKDFLSKRQFMKDIVGNTKANEKARELTMLKENLDNYRKRYKGYQFPSDEQIRIDLEKRIQPILNKSRKLNSDGGRIGLKAGMTKRAFLKLMGGTGAAIGAAKSGIFSGFGKGAGKQVAKEVVKKSTSTPPAYFFELAEKIKTLGRVTDGPQERIKIHSMPAKDGKSELMLTEDIGTGEMQIKKIGKEEDMTTKVETMEYVPGSSQADETTQGIPADSYDEYTEVNSRIYKDEFNEPDIIDGIEVDEIIEEVKDQAPSIKKAGGGIARMLGE